MSDELLRAFAMRRLDWSEVGHTSTVTFTKSPGEVITIPMSEKEAHEVLARRRYPSGPWPFQAQSANPVDTDVVRPKSRAQRET